MQIIRVECPYCGKEVSAEIREGANFVNCDEYHGLGMNEGRVYETPRGCGHRYIVEKEEIVTTRITTHKVLKGKEVDYETVLRGV